MLLLGSTCICGSLTSENMLFELSLVLFMLNLSSAAQDIVVDSLAINILDASELGTGNTIQVVAYKAGSVFAGGTLLWIRDVGSWFAMWILFSALYFITCTMVYSLDLEGSRVKSVVAGASFTRKNIFLYIKDNTRFIFKVDGTVWMVGFVLFYKLCERVTQGNG